MSRILCKKRKIVNKIKFGILECHENVIILFIYLFVYLFIYLLTYLLAYLNACLLTYLLTYLLIYGGKGRIRLRAYKTKNTVKIPVSLLG